MLIPESKMTGPSPDGFSNKIFLDKYSRLRQNWRKDFLSIHEALMELSGQEISETTREILEGFSKEKSNLIPILQKTQDKIGYLPRISLVEIALYLDIAPVEAYGVATFYNRFRLNPPGKHSVKVCLGTACHMKGGNISLEAWQRRLNIGVRQTTPNGEFDLDTVACVGCCHLAPVTVVDGNAIGSAEPTKVDGILLGFGYKVEAMDKKDK
jgi:NADH-quinone oxidoreductase subunit E